MTAAQTSAPEHPLFGRRNLVNLVLPMLLEQVLSVTMGMADTLMVSGVGEAAVSSVSLVDSINILIIQILAALATGGAVIGSQYLGRRDAENARRSAAQLYTVLAVSTVAVMVLSLAFCRPILRGVFGQIDDDVMRYAQQYFIVSAISYPFIGAYNAGAALFRAQGNSRISMLASLVMNVINICGNALLIYGFGMGVLGAALATLVGRIFAAVWVFRQQQQFENPLRIGSLAELRPEKEMILRILNIGIPSGLENGMFQIGKLLVLGLVTPLGTSATAANAIANSVAGVVNVPGNAISLSLITVVGQCMGAGDSKQAVGYTKKLMAIVYLAMGTLSVLLFFFAAPVVGLFGLTAAAAAMAVEVLRWCAVFDLIFWPMSFSLPNALRASGDAKFTMIVSMCSMWIFRIGFSFLLVPQIGLLGVWVAMFIDWIVRAVVFLIRFLSGRWKTKKVI